MLRAALIALLVAVPAPLLAQQTAQSGGPHVVVTGETLWDLARRYYSNPFDWRRIWEANRDQIEDPHWIYPGQQLVIPDVTTGTVTGIQVATPAQQGQQRAAPAGPVPGPGDRTVFYPQAEESDGPPEGVDYEQLYFVTPDLFHASGWIDPTSDRTPRHLGVVAAFEAGENLRSKRTRLQQHDLVRVAITGGASPAVGDELTAFRIRDRVDDVGHVAVPTGMLTVVAVDGDTVIAEPSNEFDQMALGDFVSSTDPFTLDRSDRPTPLEEPGMAATVVAFQVPNQLNSRGTVLFLDKGSLDGVHTGDVFELRLGGGEGWSGKVAGRVIVHRVRENTAAARVIQVTNPVFFQGTTVHMVARMSEASQ
jgi:hypothetical protein